MSQPSIASNQSSTDPQKQSETTQPESGFDMSSIDLLDLDQVRIDPTWSLRVPAGIALRKRVLPLCELDGTVYCAAADPGDNTTRQSISRLVGMPVKFLEVDPNQLRVELTRIYGKLSGANSKASARREDGEADDAATIFDEALLAAVLRDASDIHFVPTDVNFLVRLRVDGKLETYREMPLDMHGPVTSRLKVLSGLDIAEKRAPQDGRFNTRVGPNSEKLDLRVATLPTRYGERTTIRLLATASNSLTMERLGMSQTGIEMFRRSLARPFGMVLLTGPTGSGKSTSLYVALTELLAHRGGNLITVEDPIEYEIRGASQVEVDGSDRVSFIHALRSILRHDPDAIMIGEIRDAETADIAVKASLTGHLVFSTLHTNNAAGVVTRLSDLGVDRFLIAATLRLAIAQRLVRRLCPHCRQPRALKPEEAALIGRRDLAGRTVYDPGGCVYCAGRGYSGRVAMFELVEVDQKIAGMIDNNAEEAELTSELKNSGCANLVDDAVDKLLSGVTSFPEIAASVVEF